MPPRTEQPDREREQERNYWKARRAHWITAIAQAEQAIAKFREWQAQAEAELARLEA